ncbi:hypothetical protein C4J81_07840 [Deltaproteobacteria bacterium Smac51]|nr:hypothetical protein C4J81_07840 [Deltaproteobacteria bacterium Smac51]
MIFSRMSGNIWWLTNHTLDNIRFLFTIITIFYPEKLGAKENQLSGKTSYKYQLININLIKKCNRFMVN